MPDSSDDSATEGVGLLQNDPSDSETMSPGSKDNNGNGYLDVEASESGGIGSGSDDESSESDSDEASILGGGGSSRRGPRAFFPHFKKLPIELRHRIWEFFCPDLHPSPRVFSFQMTCYPKQDVIWESAVLDHQIAPANAMLGLHRESREIALKAFPDTLAIREGRRIVRFNKQRDIVHLNGHKKSWSHNAFVRGFSENVRNLALDVELEEDAGEMQIFTHFPNLVNFFDFKWRNEARAPHSLRWCASDKVHRYELQQLQKDLLVGEDLHFIYCWPDVDNHREFAEKYASAAQEAEVALGELEEMAEQDDDLGDMLADDLDRFTNIKYWRMTCFGWDAADRFSAFLAKYKDVDPDAPIEDDDDGEVSTSGEDDDDSDRNEYESDGIDDGPLEEESFDEDEDDLLVDTRQESENEEDGGASDFGDFSPLRDQDGNMLVEGDASAADFSSPEPESDENDRRRRGGRNAIVLSDDVDEDEEESCRTTQEADRRVPVLLSDEDEEEQPSQSTGRPRRVVLSDDEDEDVEEEPAKPARPAGRRARVLPSDDEDEDDEDDGGAEVNNSGPRANADSEDEPADARRPLSLAEKLQRNRRQNPVSDEEESEESSEEDEEEAPPKQMSLAQKLMAHRRRNPIASDSEGDSGGSEDDDEEDEDEDEEEDENGIFMSLADEGESDDEEPEDDEY